MMDALFFQNKQCPSEWAWSCCKIGNYIEIINGAHNERGNRTIYENYFFTDIAMIETRPVQ